MKKIEMENKISNLINDENWHIISIKTKKTAQVEKLINRWANNLDTNIVVFDPKKYNKYIPTSHLYINLDKDQLEKLYKFNYKNGNILGKIDKITSIEFSSFYDNINKNINKITENFIINKSYLISSGAFAGLNITILEIKNNTVFGNVIIFGRETKIEIDRDNITIS